MFHPQTPANIDKPTIFDKNYTRWRLRNHLKSNQAIKKKAGKTAVRGSQRQSLAWAFEKTVFFPVAVRVRDKKKQSTGKANKVKIASA